MVLISTSPPPPQKVRCYWIVQCQGIINWFHYTLQQHIFETWTDLGFCETKKKKIAKIELEKRHDLKRWSVFNTLILATDDRWYFDRSSIAPTQNFDFYCLLNKDGNKRCLWWLKQTCLNGFNITAVSSFIFTVWFCISIEEASWAI